MKPTSAKKMLVSSDSPLDLAIAPKTGSISLGAFSVPTDVLIDHGLTFTPLPYMQWTTDPSWTNTYESNSGPIGLVGYLYGTGTYANATRYRLEFKNNTSSPITIYYRVFSYPPSNLINEKAPFTSNTGNSFLTNSDQNYTKLFSASIINIAASNSSLSTTSVTHNIGERPQVILWSTLGSEIVLRTGNLPEDPATPFALGGSYCEPTDTQLIFYNRGPAVTYHYRIYLDKQ